MASVVAWGNQVGRWRCGVVAEVVAATDQAATVEVRCLWQSVGWGYQVHYCDAYVSCEGQSSGAGGVFASSGYGETRDMMAATARFEVARGDADRHVRCAASFVMPAYHPGTSSASVDLLVPAVPCDLPAAPAGVEAELSGSSVIYVSWDNGSDPSAKRPWGSVEVEARRDGGAWGAVPGFPATLPGDASSYLFQGASPNAKYGFRVRAANARGASAWAESGEVRTAPAAPTGVSASFSAGSATVAWTPQDLWADRYEVQASADGGKTWRAGAYCSGPPYADPNPPAGTSVVYRVRALCGAAEGQWAKAPAISTYTDADYPAVAISSPVSVFVDRPLVVAFSATAGSGSVVGFHADLVVGGSVVESQVLGAYSTSVTFRADSVPDGGSCLVRITATNSAGLSSTAVRALTADYLPPSAPVLSVSARGGVAAVRALSEAGPGTCAGTTWALYRLDLATGEALEVAAGIDNGEWAEDATAPLNTRLVYRATMASDGGKESSAECRAYVASDAGEVRFDGGGAYRMAFNLEITEGAEKAGQAYDFADGGEGGGLPAWYGSPGLSASWSVTFAIRSADLAAFRRDMRACGTAWFRDPAGRVLHAHPVWTVSRIGRGWWAVSAELTEVAR